MRRIRDLLKIVVTIAATFFTSGGPHRHRVFPWDTLPPTTGV